MKIGKILASSIEIAGESTISMPIYNVKWKHNQIINNLFWYCKHYHEGTNFGRTIGDPFITYGYANKETEDATKFTDCFSFIFTQYITQIAGMWPVCR